MEATTLQVTAALVTVVASGVAIVFTWTNSLCDSGLGRWVSVEDTGGRSGIHLRADGRWCRGTQDGALDRGCEHLRPLDFQASCCPLVGANCRMEGFPDCGLGYSSRGENLKLRPVNQRSEPSVEQLDELAVRRPDPSLT